MEPISAGLAAAGLIKDLMAQRDARNRANQNLQLQLAGLEEARQAGYGAQADARKALADALFSAQTGQANLLRSAGGIRTDQFGNVTYYDPEQGREVTLLTPEQQYLQRGEQAERGRALARAAQASEDYARERAGYLYKAPPSEEAIRQDLTSLLTRARGQGERELNTLLNRIQLRAAPMNVAQSASTAQTAGEKYAEDALKAREQALQEYGTRQQQHAQEYLPAMAAFEKTANYMPAEGPTGKQAAALAASQGGDILGALGNYAKLLPELYMKGGTLQEKANEDLMKGLLASYQQGNFAGQAATKASGGQLGGIANLINALKPGKADKTQSTEPPGPASIGTAEQTSTDEPIVTPTVTPTVAPTFTPPPSMTATPGVFAPDIGGFGSVSDYGGFGYKTPWSFG